MSRNVSSDASTGGSAVVDSSGRLLPALAVLAVVASSCEVHGSGGPAYPTNCLREASSEAAEMECFKLHREQYQEHNDG